MNAAPTVDVTPSLTCFFTWNAKRTSTYSSSIGVAEFTSSVSTMPRKRVVVKPKPCAYTSTEPGVLPIGVFIIVSENTYNTCPCASARDVGCPCVPCT